MKSVREGTDYSPEITVVMFKNFSIVVKILTTSSLNYFQGRSPEGS